MANYPDRRHHRARLVRNAMREKILDFSWGEVLPSEDELIIRYGVGRNVIREALALLVQENLLRRVQGVGTQPNRYVIVHPLDSLQSIAEGNKLHQPGRVVTYRLLEWLVLDATPAAAELLRLQPGEPVIRWERLALGPEPLTLWSSILRSDLGLSRPPVLENSENGGTFVHLERAGHLVTCAEHLTGAAPADAGTAELLRVETGTALMVQHRKTFLADGALAEVATGYYRPDQIFISNRYRRHGVQPTQPQ